MKAILKQIDNLMSQINMGLYTKNEVNINLRAIRQNALDKFEEGSDEFQQIVYALLDAQCLASDIG